MVAIPTVDGHHKTNSGILEGFLSHSAVTSMLYLFMFLYFGFQFCIFRGFFCMQMCLSRLLCVLLRFILFWFIFQFNCLVCLILVCFIFSLNRSIYHFFDSYLFSNETEQEKVCILMGGDLERICHCLGRGNNNQIKLYKNFIKKGKTHSQPLDWAQNMLKNRVSEEGLKEPKTPGEMTHIMN